MIEKGLCQCGCGQRTNLTPQIICKKGLQKGEPYGFCKGHRIIKRWGSEHPMWNGGKSKRNGYSVTMMKNHPRAMRGYVYDHVLIVEKIIGKPLDPSHPIHYFPKYPSNQIVICEDAAYHNILHMRYRASKSCGHANWRKCEYCHQWDDLKNLKLTGSNKIYHIPCRNAYKRSKWIPRSNHIINLTVV